MIGSGCRTGVELARAWEEVQIEARGMAEYLGEELELNFAMDVEGIGEGREDGSTRKLLVQGREKMMTKVLGKSLKSHPNKQARPVLA